MEHSVQIRNDRDRTTLAWLQRHVGETALTAAIRACGGESKPYLSRVCRRLGVMPPAFEEFRPFAPSAVGENALAGIRLLLSSRTNAPLAARR